MLLAKKSYTEPSPIEKSHNDYIVASLQLWEYPGSSSSLLHPLYHTVMLEWLEFASELEDRGEHTLRRELGEKSGEHAVKKHTVNLSSK